MPEPVESPPRSVCRIAGVGRFSTNQRRVRRVRRSAPSRSCPPCRCRSRSRVPFVPRWRVHPFSGVPVLGSPFMWKYRCLPSSMFSMLLVAYLRPSIALVSSICTNVRSAPPIRLLQCVEVPGLLQCRDHRCRLRSPGEHVAHQQPCRASVPVFERVDLHETVVQPAGRSSIGLQFIGSRLPSVGSPPSLRGACAPVTVAALYPLLPFSCSVVPGSFRATSACRARSSSLTTPSAGVSPPTTEFRRESGVDGSLIGRPTHLVRRTAGHGPTRPGNVAVVIKHVRTAHTAHTAGLRSAHDMGAIRDG